MGNELYGVGQQEYKECIFYWALNLIYVRPSSTPVLLTKVIEMMVQFYKQEAQKL